MWLSRTPNHFQESMTPLHSYLEWNTFQYEIPSQIKETPNNKFGYGYGNCKSVLKMRMHFWEIWWISRWLDKKHYHDRKLKWKQFEDGEEAYVFFPRRKPGASPKLTSFWQGPFKVIKKMSDWTYLVNCGPRGSDQVIHVDRMRKKSTSNFHWVRTTIYCVITKS